MKAVFLRNQVTFINELIPLLNIYIKCVGLWKKINSRNQANKQSLFLIIRTFSFQPVRVRTEFTCLRKTLFCCGCLSQAVDYQFTYASLLTIDQ